MEFMGKDLAEAGRTVENVPKTGKGSKKMAYFPLFVDLEGRQVLVVGGGKIAVRRVRTLFGVQVPDHCCISGSV